MTRRLLHHLLVPVLRRLLAAADRVPCAWANTTDQDGTP